MHHAAVVHHGHAVAEPLRKVQVLLDEQDGNATAPELHQGLDHAVDDGGGQAPSRLAPEQQPPPPPPGPGPTAALSFRRPGTSPAGCFQTFPSAENTPKIPCSRCASICAARRAWRAASSMFSLTLRSAKMPMFSGT